ncbi:hypothetical protein KQH43_31760, partial [Streptomyces sp. EL5]|uniref:hypothetical protein n=1 Tax=Streptomyces sp. EL5 TaxID=2841665 RepID=UPI0020941072
LVVAAMQVIIVAAHCSKLLEFEEARRSYWVMTQVPPLGQLFVLLGGTATHAARCARIGSYASWRLA